MDISFKKSSMAKKETLEQQITSLQNKGNLNKEEVEKLSELQKEKAQQDQFINEATLQHLQNKGINWEKANFFDY
jgi:hypothetical protein